MARDYVSEIEEIKSRRAFDSSYSEAYDRLREIKKSFSEISPDNKELLRYFPITLVATLEGCFRIIISELVNLGGKYIDNCDSIFKNNKISFDIVRAFEGKRISVGDFVSHTISINRLSDIHSIMSTILGSDFLNLLNNHKDSVRVRIDPENTGLMINNPSTIYQSIEKTFELRHIFCHETATKVNYSHNEINACVESVALFIEAAIDYVETITNPDSILTQVELNFKAKEEMEASVSALSAAYEELLALHQETPELQTKLSTAYDSFNVYKDNFSEYCADRFFGGSIRPLIYFHTSNILTKSFSELIRSELEDLKNI